jgi:hypothetical protein
LQKRHGPIAAGPLAGELERLGDLLCAAMLDKASQAFLQRALELRSGQPPLGVIPPQPPGRPVQPIQQQPAPQHRTPLLRRLRGR